MIAGTWLRVSVILAVVLTVNVASAAELEINVDVARLLEQPKIIGSLGSGAGAADTGGDIAFQNTSQITTIHVQPAGTLNADDLVITELDAVGKDIVEYNVVVGGFSDVCDGVAASAPPYDVTVSLWTVTDGTEPGQVYPLLSPGQPLTEIPGSACTFTDLPVDVDGALHLLNCRVSPGIMLPVQLFIVGDFDHPEACAGFALADGPPQNGESSGSFRSTVACTGGPGPGTCPNLGVPVECGDTGNELGESCHFEFPPGNQLDWLFTRFNPPFEDLGNFFANVVVVGQPWACCDLVDYMCVNVRESECTDMGGVFTKGALCNDLVAPCSEAGACCVTATGQCRDTIERLCDGYLEFFVPGESCDGGQVICPIPDNVPTISQWGALVLSILLVIGLTIKFGRQPAPAD